MRLRTLELPFVLQDKLVVVKADIHGADRSVGIMEPFIEGFEIVDVFGDPTACDTLDLDAVLDDETLQRRVENAYWREFPDEWNWPTRWAPLARDW